MNNLQYWLAQIGSRKNRISSLDLLIEPTELPGDKWITKGERAWRIGFFGGASERLQRARRAGKYAAIRSFEQQDGSKWLWIEVIPLTSTEDAIADIPSIWDRLVRNPDAIARASTEEVINEEQIASLSNSLLLEQTGESGLSKTSARYVGGNFENVVVVIACSGIDTAWNWSEVHSVAELQVERLRARL